MDRTTNREQWCKRIERWQNSGLTAREFATETGLSLHTLRWWRTQFLREARDREGVVKGTPKPNFIEVTESLNQTTAVKKESGLELVLSDILIKVPIGFDERTLCRVLSAIRQL